MLTGRRLTQNDINLKSVVWVSCFKMTAMLKKTNKFRHKSTLYTASVSSYVYTVYREYICSAPNTVSLNSCQPVGKEWETWLSSVLRLEQLFTSRSAQYITVNDLRRHTSHPHISRMLKWAKSIHTFPFDVTSCPCIICLVSGFWQFLSSLWVIECSFGICPQLPYAIEVHEPLGWAMPTQCLKYKRSLATNASLRLNWQNWMPPSLILYHWKKIEGNSHYI